VTTHTHRRKPSQYKTNIVCYSVRGLPARRYTNKSKRLNRPSFTNFVVSQVEYSNHTSRVQQSCARLVLWKGVEVCSYSYVGLLVFHYTTSISMHARSPHSAYLDAHLNLNYSYSY